MAHPARTHPAHDDDAPSLDPGAIEQAFARERARRRTRIERRFAARTSKARFWVMLAVLLLLTVVIALIAYHQVQRTFGL